MASLGEISVALKAETAQFDSAMKSSTGLMGKAAGAAAGLAAAAAAVAGAAAGAAAATFSLVKGVAAAGDAAAKAAGRMGTTAEAVQELKHAAELSGSSIEDVEKAFVRLNKNAQDAADGTRTAVDTFGRLGVSVRDSNGNLKDSEALFMESAAAIAAMENKTQQAAAAAEVFGKSGTKLLPMLKSGADGIAAMRREARDLGIVLSNDAAATSERFNDTLDRLNKSFEGIKVQVGAALLPAFTKLADVTLGVVRRFLEQVDVSKYMQQGIKFLTEQAVGLLGTLIEFSPVLAGVATAMRVAVNVQQMFAEGAKVIGKLIGGVGATIVEFVTGALSGFVGGVSEVAKALGEDELAGSLAKAEKGIASVAQTMGGLASSAFDSLDDSVASLAGDFGDIDSAISDLASGATTSALRDTLTGIRDTIESVGTAQLDTATKFESGADRQVSAVRKVKKELEDLSGFLGDFTPRTAAEEADRRWNAAGADAAFEQGRIDNFPTGDFGSSSFKWDTPERGAALATSGPSSSTGAAAAMDALGKKSELLGASLDVLNAGVTGLIGPFVQLWASSEKMGEVFALLDSLLDPLRRFVDMVGGQLLKVLAPVVNLFNSLGPVLDLFLVAMNPIILPLKIVAKGFEVLSKPLEWLSDAIRSIVDWFSRAGKSIRVFLHNLNPANKRWEVDEQGNIREKKSGKLIDGADNGAITGTMSDLAGATDDATTALEDLGESVEVVVKEISASARRMAEAGSAFAQRMGVFVDPLATMGFGSGQVNVWADFTDQLGLASRGLAGTADAARAASEALTNVPVIFRANLARAQVSGGPTGSGSFGGGAPLGNGASTTQIFDNVFQILASDPDELSRNLQRQTFVRTGNPIGAGGASFVWEGV